MKIELLTLYETAVIDAVNDIVFSLLRFSELCFWISHEMLKKLWIEILQTVRTDDIVVKEDHELWTNCLHSITDLLTDHICCKIDWLLIRKMYRKLNDRRIFFMHFEWKNLSSCLCWINIVILQMLINLIRIVLYLQASLIQFFVDIFVEILHYLNWWTDLNIYMSLILSNEIWIVENHSVIINDNILIINLFCESSK